MRSSKRNLFSHSPLQALASGSWNRIFSIVNCQPRLKEHQTAPSMARPMQLLIPIRLRVLTRFAQAALLGLIAAHPEHAYRTGMTLLVQLLGGMLRVLAVGGVTHV